MPFLLYNGQSRNGRGYRRFVFISWSIGAYSFLCSNHSQRAPAYTQNEARVEEKARDIKRVEGKRQTMHRVNEKVAIATTENTATWRDSKGMNRNAISDAKVLMQLCGNDAGFYKWIILRMLRIKAMMFDELGYASTKRMYKCNEMMRC
jgi:hypothetical protein